MGIGTRMEQEKKVRENERNQSNGRMEIGKWNDKRGNEKKITEHKVRDIKNKQL